LRALTRHELRKEVPAMTVTAHCLNAIGLFLGMAGVVVIFVWGPPQPSFEESVGVALDSNTVLVDGTKISDLEKANKRLKRRHRILSRIGLGLVGVGFLFQFVALWVPA
jgi:hypothetical protein